MDKLLSAAGHNIQNAEAVKIMHQVHADLHVNGLANTDHPTKDQTNENNISIYCILIDL